MSVIVASPLTIYFVIYSIRAMWGGQHRLEHVLGQEHLFKRILVLFAAGMWAGLTVYSFLPENAQRFAQSSCKPQPLLLSFFLMTPISVGIMKKDQKPWLGPTVATPLLLIILAWVVAIFLKRHIIWPRGEPYRFNFWKVL